MAKSILIDLEKNIISGIDIVSIEKKNYVEPDNIIIEGKEFNPTDLDPKLCLNFKSATKCLIASQKININSIYGLRSMYDIHDLYPVSDHWWPKTNPSLSKTILSKIWINPDKELVTAKKSNDELIKVQCGHDDEFDPYIGVALAYCYQQFGSKAAFRRAVDKITPKLKKKKKVVKKHDVFPMKEEVVETIYGNDKPVINFYETFTVVKQDEYEIGDIVKICADLHAGDDYDVYCCTSMLGYAGDKYEIVDKINSTNIITGESRIVYKLKYIDGIMILEHYWTADMFEGKVVSKE